MKGTKPKLYFAISKIYNNTYRFTCFIYDTCFLSFIDSELKNHSLFIYFEKIKQYFNPKKPSYVTKKISLTLYRCNIDRFT